MTDELSARRERKQTERQQWLESARKQLEESAATRDPLSRQFLEGAAANVKDPRPAQRVPVSRVYPEHDESSEHELMAEIAADGFTAADFPDPIDVLERTDGTLWTCEHEAKLSYLRMTSPDALIPVVIVAREQPEEGQS